MLRYTTTPWARDRLAAYPDEALAIESMRRATYLEGMLSLSGRSWRGPWTAIVNIASAPTNTLRCEARTLDAAVRGAIARAERAAAA